MKVGRGRCLSMRSGVRFMDLWRIIRMGIVEFFGVPSALSVRSLTIILVFGHLGLKRKN